MCPPVLLAVGAAASAIGTGTKIAGDIAGANAQAEQYDKNKQSALEALSNDYTDLNLRGAQEQQATAQTIMQADRQARQAHAQAAVSAGEAGVTGASVDALLGNLERDRLQFGVGANRNLEATLQQIERQKVAARTQSTQRINSIPAPNPWLTGLRIGGDLIGGVGDQTNIWNPNKGR